MKLRWTPKRVAAVSLTAVLVVAAGITAGLTLGGTPRTVHRPPPASAPPSPKPASQLYSPFTGEPVTSLGPVIAVKIDNIVYARPQTGLGVADIVYVIPVEGGLSRFMAIYSSQVPPVIGPVRSAREDDLELLRQFGTPAFAYSGAQPQLLPVVEHARTIDLYSGIVGGYYRDDRRIAPYNLYARGPALQAEAARASTAHDIGFRFGPAPAGGQEATTETVAYPAASFTFTYSPSAGRWLVSMDGRAALTTDGGQLSAATVVIQHTVVRTSQYIEWGALPPYAESTGSGSALVLRDGLAYQAHWSRPALDGGTTFTTSTGQPMAFAPGPVWVVLTS
jgi:Protein of unknown function (DUF3048) N-terminal domain/Protein of unknown function (DUF3048) C-terminal domain